MDNPLFSVLIANYNNGKYLMDAIESVKAQTYTNWEIIIVDDGSTDNSQELYKQLEQDSRIHVFYNEENKGCGFAKRRCAELANGDICGFLDPDDALEKDALEIMAKIHVVNEDVSIVYSKAFLCDTSFNIIGKVVLPDFSGGKLYFDNRWAGCMHFASYKKSFYQLTEGINPRALAGVDQDLYFKLEEVGRIYILDKFTYYYVVRGHENAISTNLETYGRLWYWNLEMRRDACIRRGLDVHEVLQPDFDMVLKNYVSKVVESQNEELIAFFVNKRIKEALYEKEKEIRASKAYRLGKCLLKPFSWVGRCLK